MVTTATATAAAAATATTATATAPGAAAAAARLTERSWRASTKGKGRRQRRWRERGRGHGRGVGFICWAKQSAISLTPYPPSNIDITCVQQPRQDRPRRRQPPVNPLNGVQYLLCTQYYTKLRTPRFCSASQPTNTEWKRSAATPIRPVGRPEIAVLRQNVGGTCRIKSSPSR